MNVMSRFLNDPGALLSRSKRQNIRKNSYRCLFLYLVYIQSICIEEYFVTFFLNNNFFREHVTSSEDRLFVRK